jgi:hypothetical protein
MKVITRTLLVPFFALGALGVVYAQQTLSPREVLIKEVHDTQSNVETVHLKDGLLIVITADSPDTVTIIHKAIAKYLEKKTSAKEPSRDLSSQMLGEMKSGTAANTTSNDAHFARMMAEMKSGNLSEQVENTSRGAVIVYATRDESLLKMLHDDCCKWCGPCGPNSTATCCARC